MKMIKNLIQEKILSKNLGTKVEVIRIKPSSEEPIRDEALKQILDEIISPELKNFGLQWNGNYHWLGEYSNCIRKGFHYQLCKGCQGTMIWGVSLDFIPIVSGNKLVYSRTKTNIIFHVFEWPKEYGIVMATGKKTYGKGIASYWGVIETRRTIKEMFDRENDKIGKWFNTASSIDGIINLAENLVYKSKEVNHPYPNYALAFLHSKVGRINESIKLIEEEFKSNLYSDELKQKILEKIHAVAGARYQ